MLTNKLLAALGLAGALLFGATTDASANPWHGSHFRIAPIYRAPVYRAPVYPMPVYRAPVVVYGPSYAPAYYQTPVYAPVYGAPVWRHRGWVHGYGRRW